MLDIEKLRKENEIEDNVLVSISVLVYNHEKYIVQTLESILMQEVDFTYEIVIGEDCSTDSTRKILLSYYEKYSNIIKLILQPYNKGNIQNSFDVVNKCRGKYIACLEGDDYWSDRHKLQKQVAFLEENSKYFATSHNTSELLNGKFHKKEGEYGTNLPERIYTKNDALSHKYIGHTSSIVFRNFFKNMTQDEITKYLCLKISGDSSLSVVIGILGDCYCFAEIMSVHRVEERFGDSWSAKQSGRNLYEEHFEANLELQKYIEEEYNERMNIDWKFLYFIKSALFVWIKNPTKQNRRIFLKLFNSKYFSKKKIIQYILERR